MCDWRPVRQRHRPFLLDVAVGEIDQLDERVVGCKHPLGLRHLADLTVIAFDAVGHINKPADFPCILKIATRVGPVFPPGANYYRIFSVPFHGKVLRFRFRLLESRRPVYKLQVGKELFPVLACDILERVADLVYDAELYIRIGEHGVYRFGESLQAVDAGDKDVLDSAVLEVGKHSEPEVRALALGHVHSEQVLEPVAVHAEDIVDGPRHGGPFLVLHLVMDCIQPDDRIHVFEAAVAPGLDFRPDLVRDAADGFRGDGASVVFLDELGDVAGALPCGVQADNLVGKAFRKDGFALLDDFWLEGAVPVPRGFDFDGAVLARDGPCRRCPCFPQDDCPFRHRGPCSGTPRA